MFHSRLHKSIQMFCKLGPGFTLIQKGKGSLGWVLTSKGVTYQRNCGTASVEEYNKIIWFYQLSC